MPVCLTVVGAVMAFSSMTGCSSMSEKPADKYAAQQGEIMARENAQLERQRAAIEEALAKQRESMHAMLEQQRLNMEKMQAQHQKDLVEVRMNNIVQLVKNKESGNCKMFCF